MLSSVQAARSFTIKNANMSLQETAGAVEVTGWHFTWCRALLTELLTPVALQVQAHLAALAVLLSLEQTLQLQQLLLAWSSVRD